MSDMTKVELLEKLKLLDIEDKNRRNAVVCSLIGHSKIRTFFFGYNYCARCEMQLGDSLGGAWKQTDEYIEGHDDTACLYALSQMGWKDKLYVDKKIYSQHKQKGSK